MIRIARGGQGRRRRCFLQTVRSENLTFLDVDPPDVQWQAGKTHSPTHRYIGKQHTDERVRVKPTIICKNRHPSSKEAARVNKGCNWALSDGQASNS